MSKQSVVELARERIADCDAIGCTNKDHRIIRDLLAIVERLPKDAMGNPITPMQKVWRPERLEMGGADVLLVGTHCVEIEHNIQWCAEYCYPSLSTAAAAAEAARAST